MAEGVIAEVVAAVENPAGEVGVRVEPCAHGEDSDPGAVLLGFGEQGTSGRGIAATVKGEGDTGAVSGAVGELGGESGRCAGGTDWMGDSTTAARTSRGQRQPGGGEQHCPTIGSGHPSHLSGDVGE